MRIGPESRPLELLATWINDAKLTGLVKDPNAMTIVSCSAEGQPHARVVLCKDFDERRLTFFTNYESQKGRDFGAGTRAAALFFWDPLFRQIKIEGEVTKTSRAVSEAYWSSRARGSQLSQWVSAQSRPLPDRATLEDEWRAADARFATDPIPCPPHWGGYVLEPRRLEFWIGRENRLHDRHEFSKSDSGWTYRMLYP